MSACVWRSSSGCDRVGGQAEKLLKFEDFDEFSPNLFKSHLSSEISEFKAAITSGKHRKSTVHAPMSHDERRVSLTSSRSTEAREAELLLSFF